MCVCVRVRVCVSVCARASVCVCARCTPTRLFFETKSWHWTLARRREGGHSTAHRPRLATVPESPGEDAAAPRSLVSRTPKQRGSPCVCSAVRQGCWGPRPHGLRVPGLCPSEPPSGRGADFRGLCVPRSSKLPVRAAAPSVGSRSVLGRGSVHRARAGGALGGRRDEGQRETLSGAPTCSGLWRGWDSTGSGRPATERWVLKARAGGCAGSCGGRDRTTGGRVPSRPGGLSSARATDPVPGAGSLWRLRDSVRVLPFRAHGQQRRVARAAGAGARSAAAITAGNPT